MPIYEYRCEACGHEFEELQKINDAPVVHCPVCDKDAVHRLISKTSFQLKGGGWYKDLYGSSSSASSSGASKSAKKSAGTATTKTDSGGSKSSSGSATASSSKTS